MSSRYLPEDLLEVGDVVPEATEEEAIHAVPELLKQARPCASPIQDPHKSRPLPTIEALGHLSQLLRDRNNIFRPSRCRLADRPNRLVREHDIALLRDGPEQALHLRPTLLHGARHSPVLPLADTHKRDEPCSTDGRGLARDEDVRLAEETAAFGVAELDEADVVVGEVGGGDLACEGT